MTDGVFDQARFVSQVAATARGALDGLSARYPGIAEDAKPFLEPAVGLISGGKRARARLAHLAWRAAGGESCHPAIVAAGAALELFQAAALIHDDVVDDAHTRRGAPAAHRSFAATHRDGHLVGDDGHYGRSVAILLGDMLLALSQLQMVEAVRMAPAPGEALEIYGEMCAEVALGQYLDVDAAAHGPGAVDALERAFTVVRHKSARYSVERPLVLGATLADASPELTAALSAVGEPLGEAFQLRDDELGVFGNPAVTGKPAGDDLAEGKLTPLILLGCDMADARDAEFIRDNLGDRTITAATVERVRTILRASGALARHEVLITQRRDLARRSIDAAPIPAAVRHELTEIANNLTSRSF